MSSAPFIACAVAVWLMVFILLFMLGIVWNINTIIFDSNKRHMELFHQRVRTQMLLRKNIRNSVAETSQFMPPQPTIYANEKVEF